MKRPGYENLTVQSRADLEYATGNFGAALELYEQLARSGDARAAKFAGFMLYFGPDVFSPDIPRDRERAAKWLRMGAESGQSLPELLLERISNAPAAATTRLVARVVQHQLQRDTKIAALTQCLARAQGLINAGYSPLEEQCFVGRGIDEPRVVDKAVWDAMRVIVRSLATGDSTTLPLPDTPGGHTWSPWPFMAMAPTTGRHSNSHDYDADTESSDLQSL
jgi:hypothetical protein